MPTIEGIPAIPAFNGPADLPSLDSWIADELSHDTKQGLVISGFKDCMAKIRKQGVID